MTLKILPLILLLYTNSIFAAVSKWESVEIKNGRVFVDIEIAGVPAKALLDTGASSISINRNFLEKNKISFKTGESYEVEGAYGATMASRIPSIETTIFGAKFPLKDVRTYSRKNRDYAMLIGLPFFKLFVIQLDYPNSRVRVITHDSINLNKRANVDMRFGAGNKSLIISLGLENDENVDMLFDTGSTGGLVLNRYFAEQRGWTEKYRTKASKSSGVTKTIVSENLRLPSLIFGPFELENVKVSFPKSGKQSTNLAQKQTMERSSIGVGVKGVKKVAGYKGIAGGDIFKHFVVTLDAKHALLHVAEPE